jgi:uncharacterized protein YkwD
VNSEFENWKLFRISIFGFRILPKARCMQKSSGFRHPRARRLARVALTEAAVALAVAGCWLAGAPRAVAATQLYSQGDPTPEEQLMLQLVNRARANPAAEAAGDGIDLNEGLSAGTITTNAKPPLAFNSNLLASARGHSLWMLANDTFSHFEGTNDPGDRMTAAGYVFSGNWTWGENIAWRGSTGPTPPVGPTVAQEHQDLFVDTYEPGRGHRLNILDPGFREVGVGVETGVFTSGANNYNAVMVTQDFATSGASPGPFLVGVVYRDNDGDGFYSVGEGSGGVAVTPERGTFYAVTSTSGGYAVPLLGLSGTLQVTFSGGPLTQPITRTVVLSGENLGLDLEFGQVSLPFTFVTGSAHYGNQGQFDVDVQGPAGVVVTVQASPDLKTWSFAGQVTLTGGQAHFTDTPPSGTARQFYRVMGQ